MICKLYQAAKALAVVVVFSHTAADAGRRSASLRPTLERMLPASSSRAQPAHCGSECTMQYGVAPMDTRANQVDVLAAAIIQLHDSLHLLVNNLSNTESNPRSAKLARRMQASSTAVARTISQSVRRVAKVASGHEINGKKRSRNRALWSPRRFPPASCPPGAASARQRVVPRRVRNSSSLLILIRHRRGKGEASGATANARRRTERVMLQDKTLGRMTRRSQCGEASLKQRCIIG